MKFLITLPDDFRLVVIGRRGPGPLSEQCFGNLEIARHSDLDIFGRAFVKINLMAASLNPRCIVGKFRPVVEAVSLPEDVGPEHLRRLHRYITAAVDGGRTAVGQKFAERIGDLYGRDGGAVVLGRLPSDRKSVV